MKWIKELWRRLTYLARRKQMDVDLAEEMRLHVELRAAETGSDSALKQFGNVTRLKEKSRDAWGWGWLRGEGACAGAGAAKARAANRAGRAARRRR